MWFLYHVKPNLVVILSKMSKIHKSKYNYRSSKRSGLEVNLKGFLCSCNNREKDCIREAYNLLNKYADKLYPEPAPEEPTKKEDSIEEDLKNELAKLKSNAKHVKRFQVLESGAKNFLFINTTVEDPVMLAELIVLDIAETKLQQTKFLIRLIPIEITCKAYLHDIEIAFVALAEKHFKASPKTFSVAYNHRNNNSLNRDEVVKVVADVVFKVQPDSKVDLKSPDVSVVIEAIKGICLIGVVPNYFKYKKYNLLSLCDQPESTGESIETEEKITKPDEVIVTT